METPQKMFRIFIVVVLFILVSFGSVSIIGLILHKKSVVNSVVTLPGFQRDMENKIPSVFPKYLVPEKDIVTVIDSYTFTKEGQQTQYTFKYSSNKSFTYNNKYFFNAIMSKKGEWSFFDSASDTKTYSSMTFKNKTGNTLNILINVDKGGVSTVEITLLK